MLMMMKALLSKRLDQIMEKDQIMERFSDLTDQKENNSSNMKLKPKLILKLKLYKKKEKKKIFVVKDLNSLVVTSNYLVSGTPLLTTTMLFSMKEVTPYQTVLKTLTGICSLDQEKLPKK